MIQSKSGKTKLTTSKINLLKLCVLGLFALCFHNPAQAQPKYYNSNSSTSYNSIPLGSSTNKVQWIYNPNIFKTAGGSGTASPTGSITKIYFRLGSTVNTSTSYANFTVSLGQGAGTTTAWSSTTFTTTLTPVFTASTFTLSGASTLSWYAITLQTPFYYDPALALVFELKSSTTTGTTTVAQDVAVANKRNYGTYSGTTGTLSTGLVDFGFDIVNSKMDLYNTGILGLTNTCGSVSDPFYVQIKNTGVVDLASGSAIPVRAVLSGGASATYNKTFNRELKIGKTDTVHMANINAFNITGNLNIKSWTSLSLDSIKSNDTNFTTKTFAGPSKPTLGFNITQTCDSVRFANTTKDPCNRILSYTWFFDNGKTSSLVSPAHAYTSPGTYNVKLLVLWGTGTRDSLLKQVIVYPKPQANFSVSNHCQGTSIDFSNFSYGAVSYRWSFGDATTSTATNPPKLYATAGTFSVKLVATSGSGCSDSITKSVTVNPKPAAKFTVPQACAGANLNFNNTTTGAVSYSWDLGDGTASTYYNPTKSYPTAGLYGITLTVTSNKGCTDVTSSNVTINPNPVAGFSVPNSCKGVTSSFSNSSTGAASYFWAFGDGITSFSPSPANLYKATGTFSVSLTATSALGCSNTLSKQVTIHPLPAPGFTSTAVCVGLATDFTNKTPSVSGGIDYIWRFGNGKQSIQQSPSHTYDASGNYNVYLIATTSAGCKDSTFNTIEVYAKPVAEFVVSDVCHGQKVYFINNSQGTVSQTWSLGDGNSSTTFSPVHTYTLPDLYRVTLNVLSANGCASSFEKNVTVKANPDLAFSAENVCFGTDAVFTNFSSGASTYRWNFGDGDSTVITQTNHTYKKTGTFTVKLTGISPKGCTSQTSKSITIYPKPVASFSAPVVCHGLPTQFSNASTGAASYAWDFGDGSGTSVLNNPSYTFFNSGNFNVKLTSVSTDNCRTEITKTITVASLPVPSFLIQDVCANVEFTPKNSSLGAITSQRWNFGDGKADTSKAPTHRYPSPGIYTIRLTVSTGLGCTDSTAKTILIYNKPLITKSPDLVVSKGYKAQLFAKGGIDYKWSPAESLDDPNIANPNATPKQSTKYQVIVANGFGCADTAWVNVELKEDFSIEPQNLFTPNGNLQNDFWVIKSIEFYPEAQVLVFDQWGRILLDQKEYKNTWDGTLKGKPLPDGTYFYAITLQGTERQYKGTVTILRN